MIRKLPFTWVLWLLVIAATPAMAGENGGDPASSNLGWTFRILNFLVLFVALLYLLLKKAPSFFGERAAGIVKAISESSNVKAEADRRLKEAEEKLTRLDEEIVKLRSKARQDGAADAERIRLTAGEEVRKIDRAARMEIEAAERAARIELQAAAAQMAVQRAEAVLRQKITPEAHVRLVRSFIRNLGSAN